MCMGTPIKQKCTLYRSSNLNKLTHLLVSPPNMAHFSGKETFSVVLGTTVTTSEIEGCVVIAEKVLKVKFSDTFVAIAAHD